MHAAGVLLCFLLYLLACMQLPLSFLYLYTHMDAFPQTHGVVHQCLTAPLLHVASLW